MAREPMSTTKLSINSSTIMYVYTCNLKHTGLMSIKRDHIMAWAKGCKGIVRGPFRLERETGLNGIIIPLLEGGEEGKEDQNTPGAAEETVLQPTVILRSSLHGDMDISARWRSCVFPCVQGDSLLVRKGGDVKFLLLQPVESGEKETRKTN